MVRQWTPDGKVTEILRPGGYDGNSLPAGGFNGPNGMTADKDGAVLLCQHGNRRIARIDKDMKVTTLVDKFEGKKLNSPERPGLPLRRLALLHRSAVRPAQGR